MVKFNHFIKYLLKERKIIMAKDKAVKPFGIADKLGYAFGDVGNDFTFILSSSFLMKFYSDVMGVGVGIVGILMMVARIVDAFTDVAMGQVVDRSKPTKDGKFIPWVKRMAGPVSVASFLMYATWFKDMPMAFKIFWMFFTYILWGSVCYTGVNIPYGSMASAVSPDPKHRASLSTWRTMGATIAGMVISVVFPLVVYYTDANGNQVLSGTKMAVAAGVCSVLALISYLICCVLTTERVKVEQKTEKFDLGALLKSLVTNKVLIGIVLASICLLLAQLTSQGMMTYVYPNYFKNTTAQSMAGVVMLPIMFVLAAVSTPLSAKFGRKALALFGSLLGGGIMILAYFMHITNPWIFIGLYAISYIGLGLFNIIIWAMITDVIDDTEVQTGERSDGTIYAVYSFARKMGQAASSGLVGGLLTFIGYTSATAFDPAVTEGIYTITCIAPATGFILVAVILMLLYPLGKKRVDENVRILAEKRESKEQA